MEWYIVPFIVILVLILSLIEWVLGDDTTLIPFNTDGRAMIGSRFKKCLHLTVGNDIKITCYSITFEPGPYCIFWII